MKTKKATIPLYDVDDLTNPHFRNAEIIMHNEQIIKGQFVKFKVPENGKGFKLYPSEKLCFLPEENGKEFRDQYELNNGIFRERPAYIIELGLDEIKKITIEPILIL